MHGNAEGQHPRGDAGLDRMPATMESPRRHRPSLVMVTNGERVVKVKPHFYLDENEWVLELECRFPADVHHHSEAWALAAAATAACHDVIAGESDSINWEDLPDMVTKEVSLDDPEEG